MVGHLSAAIDRKYGNIARFQDVLPLACLPQGKHRRMLQQPQLIICGITGAHLCELPHLLPNDPIVLATKLPYSQFPVHLALTARHKKSLARISHGAASRLQKVLTLLTNLRLIQYQAVFGKAYPGPSLFS
jgi:hypothetical protein